MGFDPANGYMYFAETTSTDVLLFNGSLEQLGTITFGSSGLGLAYDPANTDMYLVHPLTNNIAIMTAKEMN